MISTYYKSLYWSSVFIQVLPLTMALFNKAFNAQLKALLIYFVISLLNEVLSNFSPFFHIKDDYLLLHIYTIFETLLILFIYFKEFDFKNPYPMLAMGIVFTCIALLKLSGSEYNDVACSLEALMIVPLSIIYFFRLSNDLSIPRLIDYYFFWINTAFLFYFSFTFFIFLFAKYVMNNSLSLWSIHLGGNIIYNILLTIGIWKTRTYRR